MTQSKQKHKQRAFWAAFRGIQHFPPGINDTSKCNQEYPFKGEVWDSEEQAVRRNKKRSGNAAFEDWSDTATSQGTLADDRAGRRMREILP